MAKAKSERTAIVPTNASLPEHLRKKTTIKGLDVARRFVRPPRLKVVDDNSADELKTMFGVGAIVVIRGVGFEPLHLTGPKYDDKGNAILNSAPPVSITPLFMFTEYCTWNPMGVKPAIRFRTLDPHHPVAARSQNPDTREEIVKEGKIKHVEHLVFVCLLHGVEEFQGKPVLLTFQRGNHFAGRELCGLIAACRADIFARNYELVPVYRDNINLEYSWWGMDVRNPELGDPWVSEVNYHEFEGMHDELVAAHRENLIVAEYGEDENVGGTATASVPADAETAPPM